jgi:hypothetical protein
MEPRALEPPRLELVRLQFDGDPAVGRHRALAVRRDEGDHGSGRSGHHRADQLDPATFEQRSRKRAGRVVGLLRHATGELAELGDPCRHVRRLAARRKPGLDRAVGARSERLGGPHDHVEEHVAESADHEGNRTIAAWIGSHSRPACARS